MCAAVVKPAFHRMVCRETLVHWVTPSAFAVLVSMRGLDPRTAIISSLWRECQNASSGAWIAAGTVRGIQAYAGGVVCGGPHVIRGGGVSGS